MSDVTDLSSFSDPDNGTVFLMVHADDAGLCHSENLATIQCLQEGLVNSCSVMVNCPGFEEMASYLSQNPHFDHGIHLTLTCEWRTFRFGPVLPVEEVPSLVDEQGHFFKDRKTLLSKARPEEVRKEIRAQIERGLEFGLKPSHIDSHMYSLGISRDLFDIYLSIGREFGLPALVSGRLLSEVSGLDPGKVLRKHVFQIPHIHFGHFNAFKKGKLADFYRETIQNLVPGLHMILIHPAYDDQEMREVTIDHPNFGSAWRQIDTDFFSSQECRTLIEEKKVQMVNWTDLAELH